MSANTSVTAPAAERNGRVVSNKISPTRVLSKNSHLPAKLLPNPPDLLFLPGTAGDDSGDVCDVGNDAAIADGTKLGEERPDASFGLLMGIGSLVSGMIGMVPNAGSDEHDESGEELEGECTGGEVDGDPGGVFFWSCIISLS